MKEHITQEPSLEEIKKRVDGFFGRPHDKEDDTKEHYRYMYQAMLQSLKTEEQFWQSFGDKPRFHHKENVWFMLEPDDSVTIFKVEQTHKYAYEAKRGVMDKWEVVWQHNIDRNSWDSVKKSMQSKTTPVTQEQKPAQSKLINSIIGSHHWSATLLSYIMRTGEYLTEHGDETEDKHLRSWGKTLKEYALEVNFFLQSLPDPYVSQSSEIERLTKEVEQETGKCMKYQQALQKINDIRNSIVGLQTINWSEHIYPLVAALNEAGVQGMEYPEAREKFGTMIQRTVKAEAEIERLQEALRGSRDLIYFKDEETGGWMLKPMDIDFGTLLTTIDSALQPQK